MDQNKDFPSFSLLCSEVGMKMRMLNWTDSNVNLLKKFPWKRKMKRDPEMPSVRSWWFWAAIIKHYWHLITPFSSRLLLLGTIMIVQHFFITCIEIICVSWLQIREKWEMSAGRSKVWGIHGIDRNVYNVCWWGIGFLIPLFLCVCPSVPLMDVVVAGKESTIEASKAMHLTPLFELKCVPFCSLKPLPTCSHQYYLCFSSAYHHHNTPTSFSLLVSCY